MKSILFFSRFHVGGSRDSLSAKFQGQVSAAERMGLDVWYVGVDGTTVSLYNHDREYPLAKLKSLCIPTISQVLFYQQFYKSVLKLVNIRTQFDYAYVRSMFGSGMAVKALRALKKTGARIIMEIPSFGVDELGSERRLLRKAVLLLASKRGARLAQYADLFALIGKASSQYLGKPAIGIQNGIDVDALPIRRPLRTSADVIHGLVLASMCRWHGYDRLLVGLKEYKRRNPKPDVVFHFVGADGDGSLAAWKDMARKLGICDMVVFEGPKYGAQLSYFFDLCDIGVASLGLHRIGADTVSTLKVREYMARGLPFVCVSGDSLLDGKLSFCMEVPSDESPIDIDEVVRFARETRCDRDLPMKMRDYARGHMSWESQLGLVLDWFSVRESTWCESSRYKSDHGRHL